MELNCRKKSRQDRMMHSKSFGMQEVRAISQKEAEKLRPSHLMDGNNKRCLPHERKGMQGPR